MTLDELAGLLSASRYLAAGEPVEREALRVLPELADGLPAIVFDPRGPAVWSGCGEVVRAASTALAAQLLQLARGTSTEDVSGDPLVLALERLVAEGVRHSPGAAVVPVLEALRVVQGLYTSDPGFASLRADPVAMRRVGAAIQARLATACARAGKSVHVPALAWALARDRLVPLYARGTLDRDPAWPEIAAVLEVPYPADTYETVGRAVRVAVRGIVERRTSGRLTADDAAILLRFLTPARLEAGADAAAAALALDPDALAVIVPALGRLTDAKALVAQGVPADVAERLLTPAGGLAAASVLVELLGALRVWDVTSQLVAAVTPTPVRALGVPRTTPTRAVVVAVGAGRLKAEGGQREAAWEELARGVEHGIVVEGAGLAAFPDALDALRFALAVAGRLPNVAVGMACGPVYGGTDGSVVRLAGPAVDAAIRWIAGAPAPRAEGVEGGLRSVGGWLAGRGLGMDTAAADALQEARVRRGLATEADGPPGGDARVPRSVDLHRVFELDGGVLALVRVPGVSGGFEAMHLSLGEWRALLDRDGERSVPSASASAPPAPPPVAVAAPAAAVAAPEADWEIAEQEELPEEAPVTLDLGDAGEEGFATGGRGPSFDLASDDVEDTPLGADDASFSGYYLPSADSAAPSTATVEPARAAPVAPGFDLSVEDDDDDGEDTAEWTAAPSAAAPPAGAASVRAEDVSADGPLSTGAPFATPSDGFALGSADPFSAEAADPFSAEAADPFSAEAADPRSAEAADPFSAEAADPFAAASSGSGDRRAEDPFADLGRPPPDEPTAEDPFADLAPSPPDDPTSDDPFADFGPRADAAPHVTAAPSRPAEPAGARRDPSRAGAAPDFDFLLKGYACYFEKREAVFGRPYGTRMVDRHTYRWSGDTEEAYLEFLRDKIREGFVPRADLVGDLPRGVTLMPLDLDTLQRAWKDLS